MKKKIIMIAFAVLTAVGAGAQTGYDAVNLAQKDLNGTARFVGMGGAMGALGGDISTIGTNPAGIGIYRSNDAMLTFGYSSIGTESNYLGSKYEMNKNRWSFDNAGFVFSTKVGNMTSLRFVNFGFNYHKTKSFYKNMTMQGMMGSIDGMYLSQVRTMAQQGTDAQEYVYNRYEEHLNFGSKDIYSDNDAGWLGVLGWQGGLTEEDSETLPYNTYIPLIPGETDAYFLSRERGGIDQYDFNVAFNFNDRFYLGVTLGAYNVDYNKYSLYNELSVDADNREFEYALESFNRISGSGFDVKFGAILRPFESSPLRIGLAVHTPTFYKLTYTTGAVLQNFNDDIIVNTQDYLNGKDMDRDFQLQTPWVFNASLGYTVGSSLALGAEYEYEDYSTMKFKYSSNDGGGDMEFENAEVKNCLKGEHTFRIGAEYKVIPEFAFRLGYNYSSAVFRDEAVKYIPSNSLITDTDFSNKRSQSNYTLGIGYRGKMFYADLAYQLSTYKENFYPFYNEFELTQGEWTMVTPPATKVTNTRSQVLLTVGMRF